MSVTPPPISIANTLEHWLPGFWNRFYGAVWAGYYRWGGELTITSWYRDEYTNAAVGGHPDSQHRVGTALDLVPADPRLAEAFRLAGFQAVVEPTHVHVQAFPAGILRDSGFLQAVGI
jgi:hypothetical protein